MEVSSFLITKCHKLLFALMGTRNELLTFGFISFRYTICKSKPILIQKSLFCRFFKSITLTGRLYPCSPRTTWPYVLGWNLDLPLNSSQSWPKSLDPWPRRIPVLNVRTALTVARKAPRSKVIPKSRRKIKSRRFQRTKRSKEKVQVQAGDSYAFCQAKP